MFISTAKIAQLFLDRPQYTCRAASIDSQLQCKSPMSTGTYDQQPAVHLDLDPQQRLQGSNRHLEQFLKDETPPGGPPHCHYKVLMFSFHDATTHGSRFCSSTMLLLPMIHGGPWQNHSRGLLIAVASISSFHPLVPQIIVDGSSCSSTHHSHNVVHSRNIWRSIYGMLHLQ